MLWLFLACGGVDVGAGMGGQSGSESASEECLEADISAIQERTLDDLDDVTTRLIEGTAGDWFGRLTIHSNEEDLQLSIAPDFSSILYVQYADEQCPGEYRFNAVVTLLSDVSLQEEEMGTLFIQDEEQVSLLLEIPTHDLQGSLQTTEDEDAMLVVQAAQRNEAWQGSVAWFEEGVEVWVSGFTAQ